MSIGAAVRTVATCLVAAVMGLSPSAPASAHGIWQQQVARSASESCADGWSPSWAKWPNAGRGGFVCSRDVDDPSVPDQGLRYVAGMAGTFGLMTGLNTLDGYCRPSADSSEGVYASVYSIAPADSGVTYTSSGTTFNFYSPTDNNFVDIFMLCPEGWEFVWIL